MKLSRVSLLKDTIIYGLGDFLVTGINGFLLLPIYIKYLSQAQYGLFSLFNMSMTIFIYVIQFGLISAFSRIYFLYEGKERTRYFNNIVTFHFLLSIVLSIIIYLFKESVKKTLSPLLTDDIFYYAYIVAFLSFLPALYSMKYRLESKAKKFVLVQIVTAVILIISVISGLIILHKTLMGLLWALIVTNFIVWLFFLGKTLLSYNSFINLDQLKQSFKLSVPMFFSYIMVFIINKFSLILLQKSASLNTIAVFSFFQQLSNIVIIISVAAGKAIQPMIYNSTEESLNTTFTKIDSTYKNILFTISALLILFAKDLILILSNSIYAKNLSIFYLLIFSNFLYTSLLLQNTIIQYFLKSKWLFYCLTVGGIASLLTNYFLIPIWGIYGAACAILISFFCMVVANYYYTTKLIKYNVREYIFTIMKMILIILCAYLLTQITSLIIYILLKGTLTALLLFYLFKVVEGDKLIEQFKRKKI